MLLWLTFRSRLVIDVTNLRHFSLFPDELNNIFFSSILFALIINIHWSRSCNGIIIIHGKAKRAIQSFFQSVEREGKSRKDGKRPGFVRLDWIAWRTVGKQRRIKSPGKEGKVVKIISICMYCMYVFFITQLNPSFHHLMQIPFCSYPGAIRTYQMMMMMMIWGSIQAVSHLVELDFARSQQSKQPIKHLDLVQRLNAHARATAGVEIGRSVGQKPHFSSKCCTEGHGHQLIYSYICCKH